MSRLVEKLTKQTKAEPQPMGFMLMSKAKVEKTQMLLIAELAAENWDMLADKLKAVDALLLDVAKVDDLAIVEKACQVKEGAPAGGWLKSSAAAVLKKALNTECDFMAFSPAAPVTLTRKEKLGRIMEIDVNLTEGLLRAVGDLPLDAVITTGKASELALTMNRLMNIQRLVNAVNKPLLVGIPDNLSGPELQSLWDMGVGGVVVEVSDEKSAGNLAELRAAIDKLEAPAFRKKSKAMAILPRASVESAAPSKHEEEEEEDDE
jgi:hypothetical protein